MALPPVVAELRANIGDYMARMGQARAEWDKTSAAIADPTAVSEAEAGLVRLSKATASTSKESGVLGETSAEAFGQVRTGAAGTIPGLGELFNTLGLIKGRFGEVAASSRESFAAMTEQAEAYKLELDRVAAARMVTLEKLSTLESGSREWTTQTAKLDTYDSRVVALNRNLAKTAELQAAARKEAIGGAALVGAGGAAAVGVAVAAGVGYESVKAALAEQSAQALLQNALSKTKESWAQYVPALDSAEAQLRKLGIADTDTMQSAQKLTVALKDPEKALNLVGLAANIARARNIDLATATGYVQKIATGHVGTLGRLGLASKDAAGNTLTVKQSIDELGKAYGGAANAYANTLQGKWDVFKAQLEHVEDAIGNGLIPKLSEALSGFEDLASWINEHIVPTLKDVWSWFEQKIVPALEHVAGIFEGALSAAFERISKATDSHRESLAKLVLAFKAVAEFVTGTVLPLWARFGAVLIDVISRALVPIIAVLAKVVDALGWLVKGAGDAASGLLTYFVKPVVDGMLWMAQKVVGAASTAFGWVPVIGGKLDGAKADIANFTANTNAMLQSWATSAGKWGNDHTAAVTAAADAAKKAASEKLPPFNISSDYATDLTNVASPAKSKAAELAKKRTSELAALRKKDREERLAALKKQREELKKEADAALAEANRIAAARAAQLQASLAAAQEAARQLDIANKLAGGGTGRVDIIDGAVINRGYSFAQAASSIRPMNVTINVAGSVTTERDLVQTVHENLLTFARQNINAGLS